MYVSPCSSPAALAELLASLMLGAEVMLLTKTYVLWRVNDLEGSLPLSGVNALSGCKCSFPAPSNQVTSVAVMREDGYSDRPASHHPSVAWVYMHCLPCKRGHSIASCCLRGNWDEAVVVLLPDQWWLTALALCHWSPIDGQSSSDYLWNVGRW